jgi:hypothetical protein
MNATLLYRIASVLYILFAAGHTYGSLNFRPPTPEGRAVIESMNNVHFQVRGATFSYGGFYKGMALAITVHLLSYAFLAWHLGALAGTNARAIGALGWVLFAAQLVLLVLSWMYFSAAPAALSALTAICLGWAAWLVERAS